MVPALDMVNHSATAATAYYEEDNSGDVSLRIRPGSNVAAGEELNISYGDKSAAEMLFSYGFIDPDSKTRQLTLHLDDFPDDPLALAKKRVFGGAPVVTFRQTERSGGDAGGVDSKSWESSFVYLMCLNEEDGLDFRILQDDAGNRQLRLFWQNEDVTERAGDMKALLQDHPLKPLFQLRAVSVVLECAADQLAELDAAPNDEQLRLLIFAGVADQSDVHMIKSLREIERSVIEAAVAELEEEVRTHTHIPNSDSIWSGLYPPLTFPTCPSDFYFYNAHLSCTLSARLSETNGWYLFAHNLEVATC